MSRVDLYSLIHKAQRAHLYALASRLGRVNFSDREELESIGQGIKEMIAHLKAHAHHELTFVHPLFTEAGSSVHALDEEHDELDEELLKLEAILDKKDWTGLYPAFNRFIGAYLLHQDEEEGLQAAILWKHFDDARLAQVFVDFQASRSPDQKMQDLIFLLPGLSVSELGKIFLDIKASAPHAAFQHVCQLAEQHMEKNRWAELREVAYGP